MIGIENVQTIDGKTISHQIDSDRDQVIDGRGLTLFPALIDPHVHFRTPGNEQKENWKSGAKAAIFGGYTTVFDMPNTAPVCTSIQRLDEKEAIVRSQLNEVDVPLRYGFYFGVDKKTFDQIPLVKERIIGIKLFLDAAAHDDTDIEALFSLAGKHDLLVAVHAEEGRMIQCQQERYRDETAFCIHSTVRNVDAAIKATEKVLALAKQYSVRLYLLHVSTKEELDIINKAKEEGVRVFAEVTPHHLFLHKGAYEQLQAKAQVNPPLRSQKHQEKLLSVLATDLIDAVGSDHAPHTVEEKLMPYGFAPSGMPGIETTLPLLLTAYHQGLISLDRIVSLTRFNIESIFRLPSNDDVVLVDLEKEKRVEEATLQTKCGWSAFSGWMLKGWPVCTILKGRVYALQREYVNSSFIAAP